MLKESRKGSRSGLLCVWLAIALAPLFTSGSSHAHDFWIEPGTFRPKLGDMISLDLRIGDEFSGETFPRDPNHLKRFELADLQISLVRPIEGRIGRSPAGSLRVVDSRHFVVVYESEFSTIQHTVSEFEAYLREENYQEKFPKATGGTVTERYARFAKALVGRQTPKTSSDRNMGLVLELLSLDAKRRKWKLLFQGRPLPRHQVALFAKGAGSQFAVTKTDGGGIAQFPAQPPGIYMIRTVYLQQKGKSEREWESFWASSTYQK